MTPTWQRARQPDDVPTPIAVAVSDYCRRAKAPASAPEVREALAALPESDDFRIRDLTDAEPEARPLGPFAVVDILRGTSPDVAAQRQSCGYYALVREMLQLVEEKTVRVVSEAAPMPPPVHHGAAPARSTKVKTARDAAEPELTVAEKIAPKKRERPVDVEEERTLAPVAPPRELPLPRGRFTRLETSRTSIDELERSPEGVDQLSVLIEQHPHRYSLLKALSHQYNARRGGPLGDVDLVQTVRNLKLEDKLINQERVRLLGAVSEQKGATGRAAWSLGLSPVEFAKVVQSAGIKQEVEELRERFRREALAARHLGARLDLLGREKYLGDLGIKKRFVDSLTRELDLLLKGAGNTLEEKIERVARDQGVAPELLTRAIERLGLSPA